MSSIEQDITRQIDFKLSMIIEDIPYLLIFAEDSTIYRIYFINLNFFDAYNLGKTYKPHFLELFDLFPIPDNLFLGVGNYRHISYSVPVLLNKKIAMYSMRMNGKPFKALDDLTDHPHMFKFRKEKFVV
jgi:hypothetical protein